MNLKPIINSTVAGTSSMTLFSYLVSEKKEENFREPLVLADLISRLSPKMRKSDAAVDGWALHYIAGFGFSSLYHKLWKSGKVKPGILSGSLLGAASGLAGILVWKGVFKLHPNPPAKDLKKYFGHLMLAHVVFGAFAGMAYKSKVEEKKFIQESK
ncbi:hypothetical protein M3O96_18325 [Aquiflexum sp. TKW24L]|uniref:hypothetical protein n=1 Tax=Aquiflexum sp. TKW24L TaxID=2942212 RepID=UPI0020BFF2B9|nr:hypothetical protein [Aquiflexum sp. TKW24L]MCL6261067.1 hypothetical protein [Aquiflexum sp. TKW24L]